jgi:hypothetical protein
MGGGAKDGYPLNYTVKKVSNFPVPSRDIPARDGKTDNFFVQCTVEDPAGVRVREKERASAS